MLAPLGYGSIEGTQDRRAVQPAAVGGKSLALEVSLGLRCGKCLMVLRLRGTIRGEILLPFHLMTRRTRGSGSLYLNSFHLWDHASLQEPGSGAQTEAGCHMRSFGLYSALLRQTRCAGYEG